MILSVYAFVLPFLGSVNCVVFCGWYWWKQKRGWPKTEHGWFLMLLGACLGLLFTLIWTSQLFNNWPGIQWVIIILYTALVGITFWLPRLVYISYRHQEGSHPEREVRK